MSMMNFMLSLVEHEKSFITSEPGAFQLIGGIALNSLPFCVIVYTSRRFYVTGNEETSILRICDVTLLKDAMVLFILSCCLNLALTGK